MMLDSIFISYLDDESHFVDSSFRLNEIDEILSLYHRFGCILFRNLFENNIQPKEITDLFTARYAKDASRRSIEFRKNLGQSFAVDSESTGVYFPNGNNAISWHSEAHFSPAYPETIFLYCHQIDVADNSGRTLLVDGIKIWNALSIVQKNFFLKNQILYMASIKLDGTHPGNVKQWYIPEPGCYDVTLDGEKSILSYSLIRSLVNKCTNNKLAFCNYLLHNPWEPQLSSMKLFPDPDYTKIITKASLETIISSLKIPYSWTRGDLLMVNNRRFMHARESYQSNSRVLELIQALQLRQ